MFKNIRGIMCLLFQLELGENGKVPEPSPILALHGMKQRGLSKQKGPKRDHPVGKVWGWLGVLHAERP